MSAHFTRDLCLLLSACVLFGCGGGGDDTENAPSAETDTSADTTAAPSASPDGGTPSSGSGLDTSTPDGTVRAAMQAVQDNEFERIWDLMPPSYQRDVNGLFKEFGTQVDAELWDKSFDLLNRYMNVMVSKEDMVYQTPEMQAVLESFKSSAGASEKLKVDLVTLENLKPIFTPLLEILTTILDSEISSSERLKSFDGRTFCAETLDPIGDNLTELSKATLAQFKKMATATENKDLPAPVMMSLDFEKAMSQQFNVRTESTQGELAVVVIESDGEQQKQNFVRVGGKWVPETLSNNFPLMLTIAKGQIPAIAAQINALKGRVMPILEQMEPLVAALEDAKTQEEFNTAFAQFNAQSQSLMSSAMGMRGLGSMMGGGSAVQVSPVTIEFQGDVTDDQLGEVIAKLEALTDDPEKAITLPKRDYGQLMLEIHPVSDPQSFASSIDFAKRAEYDPARATIVIELEPPPPSPVETPGTEENR